MKRILVFFIAMASTAIAWSKLQAEPKDWISQKSKSIARVSFVECPIAENCNSVVDPSTREATGFLFETESGDVVVVTALHAVVGQGRIEYHFQLAGEPPTETRIIAANPASDIAILELQSRPSGAEPLRALYGASQNDSEIYVIGYAFQVGTPIDSRGRGRVLGRTLGRLLPANYKKSIDALGFPDLEVSIIGLDKALQPGDSGAPIFDRDGLVVGIGNGGIPDSGGYISWAMPIDAVRDVENWDGRFPSRAGSSVSPVQYSSSIERLFYVDEFFEDDRPLGNPVLYYALRFNTSEGRLEKYVQEMSEEDRDFLYRYADLDDGTFFGGVPMTSSDKFFPGAGKAIQHGQVLDDLGGLTLGLSCYSQSDFNLILSGMVQESDVEPLLEIAQPLGDLRRQIDSSALELSVTSNFGTFLNLSSRKPIELQSFMPGVDVKLNYDRTQPTELLGGVCRVEFDKQNGITSPYERAIAQGLVILRLRLSELMAFDLFPPAALPVAGNPNRLQLWAVLPPRPILVSDDANDIFKWR
ncbi:trypsin-like peptidase domain-containing protein [Roseibium album]|uniref:trypsin-like peptidase domain-containing protein n=1 Tax=Roseibium album TaxID=311410 RepID=UPI00391C3867